MRAKRGKFLVKKCYELAKLCNLSISLLIIDHHTHNIEEINSDPIWTAKKMMALIDQKLSTKMDAVSFAANNLKLPMKRIYKKYDMMNYLSARFDIKNIKQVILNKSRLANGLSLDDFTNTPIIPQTESDSSKSPCLDVQDNLCDLTLNADGQKHQSQKHLQVPEPHVQRPVIREVQQIPNIIPVATLVDPLQYEKYSNARVLGGVGKKRNRLVVELDFSDERSAKD